MSEKCLTVNELFSGIGTQAFALEYLGIPHKVVGMAEIEKNAIEAYNVLHGETYNYGDISKIDKLDYADLWTYSFPCFTGDTLVLTDSGYKQMIDVNENDKVYTHKGRFKQVLKKFDNGMHEIWNVKTSNVDAIRTTKHHRFYVVTRSKKWNTKTNRYDSIYTEPYWKECWQLTRDDYVLSPTYTVENEFKYNGFSNISKNGRNYFVNNLQERINNPDFYWLLGKYVGDGCLGGNRKDRGLEPIGREIIIVASKKNTESKVIEEKLHNLNINYNKKEYRTIFRYSISSVELFDICSRFGRGALNKRLPIEFLNLRKDLLKSFIDGYLFADGSKVGNSYKITSVSRELLYGVGLCITKCYNVPFRLYKAEMPNTTVIEGRVVNQHDVYQLVYDLRTNIRRTGSVYLYNNYWYAVKDVIKTGKFEQVYDVEVKEDNSLVVQGLAMHNCQDLSSAGKGKGISAQDEDGKKIATRSGLLWEVERLLAKSCGYDIDSSDNKLLKNKSYEINPPKYLLLENVPELINVKKHNTFFLKWLERLNELGYNTSYGVLNANNFGIPQNRDRVFCLSVRKDVYNGGVDFPSNSVFNPAIKAGFENFVDDDVREYNGGLMIDPAISNYLLPAYTRDLEAIAACSADVLGGKEIWTCECQSGFQDHRVGLRSAPTIRHQNYHTAIFYNNQIHKLTASECWRFMGIKDKDFKKVKENTNISNPLLCGLAGNAIVVPVLMSLFAQIWLIETRGYPAGGDSGEEVPFYTVDVKEK